jgi:hypothetical protein
MSTTSPSFSPLTSGPSRPSEGHHRHHIWSHHHRFLPSPVSYCLRPLLAHILGASPFIPSSLWCRTSTPTVGHRSSTGNAVAQRRRPSPVLHHPGECRPPPPCPVPSPYAILAPTVENGTPTLLARPRHRVSPDRPRARWPRWERARRATPSRPARPVLASWPWAECSPLLCTEEILFWIEFNYRNSYKLLKYIENIIRLRKIWNKFLGNPQEHICPIKLTLSYFSWYCIVQNYMK